MILLQDSGLINRAVLAMGFEKLRLIRTLLGVIIGMTQVLLPFMIMPLYAVMRGIDLRLVQARAALVTALLIGWAAGWRASAGLGAGSPPILAATSRRQSRRRHSHSGDSLSRRPEAAQTNRAT